LLLATPDRAGGFFFAASAVAGACFFAAPDVAGDGFFLAAGLSADPGCFTASTAAGALAAMPFALVGDALALALGLALVVVASAGVVAPSTPGSLPVAFDLADALNDTKTSRPTVMRATGAGRAPPG
jgi:hypothetical protein